MIGKRGFLAIAAASLTLLAALVLRFYLDGNKGESGMGRSNRLAFPQQPPDYPLYDPRALHDERAWNIVNTHDPAIIKAGDTYYVYSTDVRVGGKPQPGIMVRKSKDLIHWEFVGRALDGVPGPAKEWSNAENLWAPDIHRFGETYYLYYSASTFGSNQSFIGVATAPSPEGPWTDRGEVWKTASGDESNAIDPNIAIDENGDPWFVYGSFFGGIYIQPLDPATGKLKNPGTGQLIARRDKRTEDGAVEGPYIIYHPGFKKYYLFVSYDSLFTDYNVRVARSDRITGPYTDFNGRVMTDTEYQPQFEVGTKILGGYRFSEGEGWVNPGHNAVLRDGDDYFIIHHARGERDPNWPYLHVRRILWTDDGWPVVSPERYAGETEQPVPEDLIAGEWEQIRFLPPIDTQMFSEPLTLEKDGRVGEADGRDFWELIDDRTLRIVRHIDGNTRRVLTAKLLPAWDWERNCPTLVFTGLDDTGTAVWGKKISGMDPS